MKLWSTGKSAYMTCFDFFFTMGDLLEISQSVVFVLFLLWKIAHEHTVVN